MPHVDVVEFHHHGVRFEDQLRLGQCVCESPEDNVMPH